MQISSSLQPSPHNNQSDLLLMGTFGGFSMNLALPPTPLCSQQQQNREGMQKHGEKNEYPVFSLAL